MIDIQPMSEKDLNSYKPLIISEYAMAIKHNYCIPFDEALKAATGQINAALNDGISSKDQYLYNIILNDTTPVCVGYLWICVQKDMKRCTIYDIYIEARFRGKGYGTEALDLVETGMKKLGISKITLHVFADNPGARALYEKIGYAITGYKMQKTLYKEEI